MLVITGEVEFETRDGDAADLPQAASRSRRIRQARVKFPAIFPKDRWLSHIDLV
jgi:hypothetical protein